MAKRGWPTGQDVGVSVHLRAHGVGVSQAVDMFFSFYVFWEHV